MPGPVHASEELGWKLNDMVYGKLVTLYSSVALEARAQEMMRTMEGSAMAKCILSFLDAANNDNLRFPWPLTVHLQKYKYVSPIYGIDSDRTKG